MIQYFLKLKSLFLLLFVLLFSLFLGPYVPLSIKSASYALSLSIKELLIFTLPFLIFSFVFSSIANLQNKAFSFVLFLIPMICLSSYLATWLAYLSGTTFIKPNIEVAHALQIKTELAPLWNFKLPKLFSNDLALLCGAMIGLFATFQFPIKAKNFAKKALTFSHGVLNYAIVPVMPLFILGFTLKLEHEKVLQLLCQNYLSLFLIIFLSTFSYLSLVFAALSSFQIKTWWFYVQNLSAAALTGFSTMSSAAAMPLTLIASEKNTQKPAIANAVIPATANIHLIGDCFTIPIFALAILLSFDMLLPSFQVYAVFAFYFVLAKFAVAAVPGGGVLVMLPILSQHLGFSGEMLSLITALYILFDPIVTSANIMGNGAFIILFSKIFKKVEF